MLLIASSILILLFQFSSFKAFLGLQKEMPISPFLFFVYLKFIGTLLCLLNALITSKTLKPFPVPKL